VEATEEEAEEEAVEATEAEEEEVAAATEVEAVDSAATEVEAVEDPEVHQEEVTETFASSRINIPKILIILTRQRPQPE